MSNTLEINQGTDIQTGVRTGAEGYVGRKQLADYDGRFGPEIDLGLGTSPIGPAPELRELLRARDPLFDLARYPGDPYHTETRELIAQALRLPSESSVMFSDNGSYGAGDEIVGHLGTRLLAPNHSFPNVAQWCVRHGVLYEPVSSDDLLPLTAQERILDIPPSQIEGSIVYVDYPNNPFGIHDPDVTRQVVDHAAENGGIPLVDMAFGEVLGEEFDDMCRYVLERNGVLIASLSKTQGLPGLRTGYVLLPKDLSENGYSGEHRLVFGLNNEAEFVYRALFKPGGDGQPLAKKHAARVAAYNADANAFLGDELRRLGLTVHDSDPETPIQVVSWDRPALHQLLASAGILTESLTDFEVTLAQNGTRRSSDNNGAAKQAMHLYGDSAVRLLTPSPQSMDDVIKRIEAVMS